MAASDGKNGNDAGICSTSLHRLGNEGVSKLKIKSEKQNNNNLKRVSKARDTLLCNSCPKCTEQYASFAKTGKKRRFWQKRHITAKQRCAGVSKMRVFGVQNGNGEVREF